MTPTPPPTSSRQLAVFIAVAGSTFLVWEVSWQRLLGLELGATVTASAIVLAVFMSGLGLGAALWGHVARHTERVERLLAGLLVGVAVVGLASHPLLARGLPALYAGLAGQAAAEPVAYLLAAVGLLAPTLLMGGVFPLLSQLAVRGGGSVAGALGRLYALETLGSALGGLLAGFVLLGMLGQLGAMAAAAAVNLVLAAWALTLRAGPLAVADEIPALVPGRRERREGVVPADPATLRRAALIATGACGLALLALQVLWLRAFKVYFTNTSYTFALVASLAILGVFAGSALFARRGPHLRDALRGLASVLVALALTALVGLVLVVRLPHLVMLPLGDALAAPLMRVLALPALTALLIVLPPAVCTGYAFPLACRMVAATRSALGRDVGLTLLANTAGAVLGPVLATFVLIPWLGAATSIALVAALVLAVAGWVESRRAAGRARNLLYGGAAALAVLVLAAPTLRVLPPSFTAFDRDVLFYRESVEGTLTVGQDRQPGGTKHTFVNNSAVIGSSYDAIKVVKMVGHFPFLLGLEARDVLVVGFGIGVTTSAIASHEVVERIDCVELVPGLLDAARYYRDLNHGVADDPRLHVIGGDGRHHLQRTDRIYDLISCDPTHPILGSGNLYTVDYFELCREHLAPGGMVSQYLPLHKLGTPEFEGLIATFGAVFPHSTVWLGHYHAVLLGSDQPLAVDFADWADAVDALGDDPHFYVDPYHLAATLALDDAAIARLIATRPLNTDDHSYTEFFRLGCLDDGNLVANLRALQESRVPPTTVLRDVPDPPRLERYAAGNRLLTEALARRLAGDVRGGLVALREATRVNPENQEYPFLLRLYHGDRAR